MNRFLSKREKPGGPGAHKRDKSRDKSSDRTNAKSFTSNDSFLSIFRSKSDPQKKADKELSLKISKIRDRLRDHGFSHIDDEQINYALSFGHTNGDVDKAYDTVLLWQESMEGCIKPYDSKITMKGAENRENVTCYLDALFFGMFARSSSFETILHNNFVEEPKRRLSFLIRLWVNMLRSGKLIETDIAKLIQEALKDCGWQEAAELEQQDTSEAFSTIAEILGLPLLTLKVDIFHTGVDDDEDDHKEIKERLLDVALPDDHNPDVPLRLEDCLETYFNNQIEVTRKLGIERSNTRSSIRSTRSHSNSKNAWQHAEIAEVSWSETPTTWGESSTAPQTPTTPISPTGRQRATSIFRQMVEDEVNGSEVPPSNRAETPSSMRKGSTRKEVMMPAWQFFNLIPWNVHKPANNDADVLHQFEQVGPVLGICLKRYSIVDGVAKKNKTFVDIPPDIGLPHFVEGEGALPESGPAMGNFKLSLQAVICHQGESLNSGHYIAFARGVTQIADGDIQSDQALNNGEKPPHYPQDLWIRHNDLANPKVSYVDIEKALKEESPYLLFYKVVPLYETSQQSCSDLELLLEAPSEPPSGPPSGPYSEPPSYADSGVGFKISSPTDGASGGYFDGPSNGSAPTIRFSSDLERPDPSRRSMNLGDEDRRGSTAMTETSLASTTSSAGISAPVTPSEETPVQRFSRAAARITKSGSKSRPTSASGEGRLSSTFTRIGWRASKEHLNRNEMTKEVAGGTDVSGQVDGAAESNRSSVVMDEHALKTDVGAPARSKTKRGRKRDKSKEPTDQSETQQHHLHKGKKDKSQMNGQREPDRECILM